MKIKEIRAMSLAEAESQVVELKASLAKERAVAAGGTRPENPGRIRGIKKNVARLLTVINEKRRAGETVPVEKKKAGKDEKKAEKPVAEKAAKEGKKEKAKGKKGKRQGRAKAKEPRVKKPAKKAGRKKKARGKKMLKKKVKKKKSAKKGVKKA